MYVPAEQFLTLRAFGAPPVVIALAAQGTFRGFMDTKTPLYAIGKYSSSFLSTFFYILFICHRTKIGNIIFGGKASP